MFIASYFASYELVLFSIIIFAFGSGCVLSMAPVGALYVFPSLKGQAAAMYGSLQMLGVFVITFIATHLTNSIEMMATLLSCISILGLIVLTMHKLPKKIKHET
ncbi:MFS transporter [Paraphotobacterium marinum]|nr:multidrug effflux MFS transporter [Paraphotobacterium marinum]